MNILWDILLLPIIGALIGWSTNVIAIKMLFWPREPIRIPIFNWVLVGLLPKRRADLAASIGQAVDESLLPMDEVLARVEATDYQKHLIDAISFHVDARLKERLPRILPENIKTVIREYVNELVSNESEYIIKQVASTTMDELKTNIHLGVLVEEKIQGFDLDQLEDLIKGIAMKELRHIEVLGGVLGFVIGVFQLLLVWART